MAEKKASTKKTTTKKTAPKTTSAKKTTAAKKTTTTKVAPKTTAKKVATKPATKKTTTKKVEPKTTVKKTVAQPKVEVKKEVKKVSFIDKVTTTIKENVGLSLLCLVCVLLIVNIIVMTIGNRTRLSNGEEVVAEINGLTITAEDLFEDLKESYGNASIVSTIDSYIIEDRLDEDELDELKESAQTYLDSIISYYEEAGYTWEDVLSDAGYADEDALFNEILLSYKQESVIKGFVESKITDDEINEYYENSVYGTYTVKNILITPVTDDDMTDEEVATAESKAKALAEEAITKLNNGESWEDVFAEYNTDEDAEDNGLLEGFTYGDVDDTFFAAVLDLEDEEYTSSPIEDSYGYNIIVKVSSTKKDALEDIKDSIITEIAVNKLTDDSTLADSTLVDLREEYELAIYDTVIKNAYSSSLETEEE